MLITEVTDKKTHKRWMQVPWLVYASDSNWIPHLKQDIEKVFNPEKNKFYREGAAKRWVLTDESGSDIGRIAAFWWKKYSHAQKQPTGCLGFFECIDHAGAASQLLDTAIEWLKSEGMEAVDGPVNFGEKDAYWGLLIENFSDMSSYRMNYNLEYYRKFFEDKGFQIYYEQWCYKRDVQLEIQEVFVRKNSILLNDPDYTVSHSRGKSIEKLAQEFVTVYNSAWAGHMGFREMPLRQAMSIVKSMKPIMDRDIMIWAYHKEKPIGFYLSIPELNEIFQYVNGNLNLWGKLIFLWRFKRRKFKTMVGIIFGVDREYHGKGVEGAMIKFAGDYVPPLNVYDQTILTWIGDFNPKMLRVAENLGAHRYRRLATYRKLFDPQKEFVRHPSIG